MHAAVRPRRRCTALGAALTRLWPGTRYCGPGWWPTRTACRTGDRPAGAGPAAGGGRVRGGRTRRRSARSVLVADAADAVRPGRRAAAAGLPDAAGSRPGTCWRCTVHHVVSDDWSDGILRRELSRSIARSWPGSRTRCRRCRCSTRTSRCGSGRWLTGDVLDRRAGLLAGAAGRGPGAGAAHRPAPPAVRVQRGAVARVPRAPAAVVDGLRAVTRRSGATMFMTAAGGVRACCWRRYSGQDDIVVGTPVAEPEPGRDRGPDRLLRQHAGAADRPVRRSDVHRAARPGAGDGAGGVRASGPAVRAAGRRAGHRA